MNRVYGDEGLRQLLASLPLLEKFTYVTLAIINHGRH